MPLDDSQGESAACPPSGLPARTTSRPFWPSISPAFMSLFLSLARFPLTEGRTVPTSVIARHEPVTIDPATDTAVAVPVGLGCPRGRD